MIHEWATTPLKGTQCTIVWHVEDLKESHAQANVQTSIIKLLKREFGKEAPLKIACRRIQGYRGTTLDYSDL